MKRRLLVLLLVCCLCFTQLNIAVVAKTQNITVTYTVKESNGYYDFQLYVKGSKADRYGRNNLGNIKKIYPKQQTFKNWRCGYSTAFSTHINGLQCSLYTTKTKVKNLYVADGNKMVCATDFKEYRIKFNLKSGEVHNLKVTLVASHKKGEPLYF